MKMQPNFKKILEDQCNVDDHKKWNRRSFLQALGLASGAAVTMANTTLAASKPVGLANAISDSESGDRVLVIVKLGGGNDGLNTIVPVYDYDTYKNKRPNLGFNENELISLNDDFALPSHATALEKLWGEGQMKVLHGVGYANSSMSHFTGSDIWSMASPDLITGSGWLGRYFEQKYPDFLFNPPEKPAAIIIGGSKLSFTDGQINYSFGVGSPEKLESIAGTGDLHDLNLVTDTCLYGDKVKFLKGVTNNTYSYAGVISEAFAGSSEYLSYPEDNALATQLSIVARLIKGGLGTKVYYVTLGGFDTHSSQSDTHNSLITKLGEAMSAFYDDLANSGWDDQVLSMTTSEFGRRTFENGSGGTAHGRASCSLFFGGGLDGNGFVGEHPDISGNNLIPTTDFRQMYATVLRDWLCVDELVIKNTMLGVEYDYLDFGFQCESVEPVTEVEEEEEEVIDEEVVVVPVEEEEEMMEEEAVDNEMSEEETSEEMTNEEEIDEVVDNGETDNMTEEEVSGEEEEMFEEETSVEVEEETEEIITDEVSEELVEQIEIEDFTYSFYHNGEETFLKINNDTTRHVDVTLYSMSGQRVGTIKNQILFEGTYDINIKEEIGLHLSTGMYLCRIISDDIYSKKVFVW